MGDFISALDWVLAVLLAGAFGLTILTHRQIRGVRLAVWAAIFIAILRWGMWAFVTNDSWPIRAAVGALIGALLLVGAPAMLKWIGSQPVADAPSKEAPPRPSPSRVESNASARPEKPHDRPVEERRHTAHHLSRTLTFDGLRPVISQQGDEVFLTGMVARVNNAGPDMLLWHITESRLYVDGTDVFNAEGNKATYISVNQGVPIDAKIPNPIKLTTDNQKITLTMHVTYDTVPKTGERKSYQRLEFPIVWESGIARLGDGKVTDQRED